MLLFAAFKRWPNVIVVRKELMKHEAWIGQLPFSIILLTSIDIRLIIMTSFIQTIEVK